MKGRTRCYEAQRSEPPSPSYVLRGIMVRGLGKGFSRVLALENCGCQSSTVLIETYLVRCNPLAD
jgi:hypothetical protein